MENIALFDTWPEDISADLELFITLTSTATSLIKALPTQQQPFQPLVRKLAYAEKHLQIVNR